MDKIRLLIVSEEPTARQGLDAIFSSENVFNILDCISMSEAHEKAVNLQPDAILLDVLGDELNYSQEIKQLKSQCPFSLILIMVEDGGCDRLMYLLSQGVDGCIPRNIMRGCLVHAIELACRTGLFCLPGSIRKKLVSSEHKRRINAVNETKKDIPASVNALTRREMEILHLMAKNYSNRKIATSLYISEPTVKTHVSSILRKLGQNNRAQAILYSHKIGIINEPLVLHK